MIPWSIFDNTRGINDPKSCSVYRILFCELAVQMCHFRVRFAVFLAALFTFASRHVACSADDNKCVGITDSERITAPEKTRHIQIRHNLQGDVHIRDADHGARTIQIDIVKSGASMDVINKIAINQTHYDIGPSVTFVLQLDHIPIDRVAFTFVVSIALAVSLLVVTVILLVWWRCRTLRIERFSPVHIGGAKLYQGDRNGTSESFLDGEVEDSAHTTQEQSVSTITSSREAGASRCPPPPPPRRVDPTYLAHIQENHAGIRSGHLCNGGDQPSKATGGGGGGMSRLGVVTLSLVAVVTGVYAACPDTPHVKVVIKIPVSITLEKLELFFNRDHHSVVFTDQWAARNSTQLYIYDLLSAPATHSAPCAPVEACTHPPPYTLKGCDSETRQCVCQRGYEMKSGNCIDIDECARSVHTCPHSATCRNKVGGFICQCGYGFYGRRNTCIACSRGCPEGHFQSSPCSMHADRVCSACTECTGATYEVRPCSASSDRQCIHAAHPLLTVDKAVTATYLDDMFREKPRRKKRKKLKVEGSSNTYLEDLHNSQNLETSHYHTAQATQFAWMRGSGLQVHVGITDVNLVAEYEDVDHDSDNMYMLKNPNNNVDKQRFRDIMNSHCRHPIPDYYSLRLEISRDRTTAAHTIVCDSKDKSKPRCPPEYNDGDFYLHRTLNEPCRKQGTFPAPLHPVDNSIVCTEGGGLLSGLFHLNESVERPIQSRCRAAISRCEQCLQEARCRHLDVLQQKCCRINCYTQPDCKQTRSVFCAQAPVECAQGDAYQYILQPVFHNVQRSFECHIRRRPPTVLYKLVYFLTLPKGGYQSKKRHRTVKALNAADQSDGVTRADYIQIAHHVGLRLHKEFILHADTDGVKANYSLRPVAPPGGGRPVDVIPVSPNIYIAPTRFRRPFDYSTHSWATGNDCRKQIDRFRNASPEDAGDVQDVNVETTKASDNGAFHYKVKSATDMPYIKFMIPGNASILPHYFSGDGPMLMINGSLHTSLELSIGGGIWIIHIQGEMSDCPAYLGVVISNRHQGEELFRYDVLVVCPVTFNLTFKLPNWGRGQNTTFDIRLTDSHSSHMVYLTRLLLDPPPLAATVTPGEVKQRSSKGETILLLILISSCAVLIVALFLFIVVSWGRCTSKFCLSAAHGKRKIFVFAYVALRFVCALVFTFTFVFAVVGALTASDRADIDTLADKQQVWLNQSLRLIEQVDEYSGSEFRRQVGLSCDARQACQRYATQLVDATKDRMQHIFDAHNTYNRLNVTHIMRRLVNETLMAYAARVAAYSAAYRKNVETGLAPRLTDYKRYLGRLGANDWFVFPRALYNSSARLQDVGVPSPLAGADINFAIFLGLEDVEQAQVTLIKFWERFNATLPRIPEFPTPQRHQELSLNMTTPSESTSRSFATMPTDQHSFAIGHQTVPGFSAALLLADVHLDTLRIIFLLLDCLIFIYRFTHTYVHASAMRCKALAESTSSDKMIDEDETAHLNDYTQRPTCGNNRVRLKTTMDQSTTARSIAMAIRSTTVPKILIACVVMLCIYEATTQIRRHVTMRTAMDVTGIGLLVEVVRLRIQSVHSYVDHQASYLSNSIGIASRHQMASELSTLQSLVSYFNMEQTRLANNYMSEAGTILKLSPGNLNVTRPEPSFINHPILPCNFLPIEPHHFIDFSVADYAREMSNNVEPIVSAFIGCVLTSAYCAIIAVMLMALVHVLCALTFREPPKSSVRRRVTFAGSTTRESDHESDDGGFRTYARETHDPCDVQNADANAECADLQYTETKV